MGEHIDKTKGKMKQAVGRMTDNKKLEREGLRDETKGRVEHVVNDAKDKVRSTPKAVKRTVE